MGVLFRVLMKVGSCVIFVGLLFVVSVYGSFNTYQTCSSCAVLWNEYYNPPGQKCMDASPLVQSPSQHHSYVINGTSTLYFNICGGTNICNGGLACLINSGEQDPVIFAYPNSEPDYDYYYNSYYQNSYMHLHYNMYDVGRYSSVTFQVSCNETTPFAVSSVDLSSDEDDEYLMVYIESSEVCNQTKPENYSPPHDFSSLSGYIYLAGEIPMFVMSEASSVKSTFEGQFFYSEIYNSFKLNGTLYSPNGKSSEASFLFDGTNEGPPIMVSYVTLPGRSSPQCILLPNTFDDDDNEVDWFSNQKNPYSLGEREYTSIHYQKGTSFNVTAYSHGSTYDPYLTLMQRTSDGFPLFVGGNVIAPFLASNEYPSFISELDWTSFSTAGISKNTFTLPSSWHCQQ